MVVSLPCDRRHTAGLRHTVGTSQHGPPYHRYVPSVWLTVVRVVTMRSRRADYSESTRQALVDSAVEMFAKRGYAATSLDAIAKRARVTKGALYHHFSGKQALFEAAFEAVETAAIAKLSDITFSGDGPIWDRAMQGVDAFIKVCLDPAYQRISIHEGPVVMGWERWRVVEEHLTFGLIRAIIEALVECGDAGDVPVETTARLLLGALSAAASTIASADDPKKAGAE